MLDVHQSPAYGEYLKSLGWGVIRIGKWQGFVRRFPLLGSLIKIQRLGQPVPWREIEKLAKEKRAFRVVVEPGWRKGDQSWLAEAKEHGFQPCRSPYSPTKTVLIDLSPAEERLFNAFTEAKRRAVRRGEKNHLVLKQETDPQTFIWLKKRSLLEKRTFPFGSAKEIQGFTQAFGPERAEFLLAYYQEKPVAGIFHLHHQKTAHYWMAASTQEGRRLFAPTWLVWEALKLAKRKGFSIYDFVGVYDERFPDKNWLGFSKFKEGFAGQPIIYPPPVVKRFWTSWPSRAR